MKKKILLMVPALLAVLFMAAPAKAHIVGIGWTQTAPGTLTFDAMHWHGTLSSPGQGGFPGTLLFDGVSYNFTSFTNNTNSMTGLDDALTNPLYSDFDSSTGTLSAIAPYFYDDWMHVTISGIAPGAHTLSAPDHPTGLTDWTLAGNVTTIGIIVTPGGAVPEPSIIALFAAGLLGLGFVARRRKHI